MYIVEIIPLFLNITSWAFAQSLKIINPNFRWLSVMLKDYHVSLAEDQVADMAWPSSAGQGQNKRSTVCGGE